MNTMITGNMALVTDTRKGKGKGPYTWYSASS